MLALKGVNALKADSLALASAVDSLPLPPNQSPKLCVVGGGSSFSLAHICLQHSRVSSD